MSRPDASEERTLPGAWDLVGQKLGRYEILHLLASGGMGAVFVARARGAGGFERLVAIKVLHRNLANEEEFVSMFLDEARLAAQIHHPNVVATLDVASSRRDHYLVMEYVLGTNLGEIAKAARASGEPIPVPISIRIGLDVLAGLAASHGLRAADGTFLNLIHRDVSPVNIQVGVDGISRLTDFGVAKAEARLSSTRKGEFKGKLSYAAPEYLSGDDNTNQRSDLFSMGVVLWEALANRRLFEATHSAAIVQQLLIEPIPKLSSVRPELAMFDGILERALMRNPPDRFASASEMGAALETAAGEFEYDGPAAHSVVGAFVEKVAAKKLQIERDAVTKARASFDEVRAAPPPSDADLPPTVSGPTPTFIRRRQPKAQRRWLMAVGGGALLVVVGLIALFSGSATDRSGSHETTGAAADAGAEDNAGDAGPGDRNAADGRATTAAQVGPGELPATPPASDANEPPSTPAADRAAQNQQSNARPPRDRPGHGPRTPPGSRQVTAPTPPPAPSNPYE